MYIFLKERTYDV